MGKRSGKPEEEKTVYERAREKCNLTRAQASERMDYISADRIERIENGRAAASPEDVIAMAAAYNDSLLCNYYCSRECPIGQQYVPAIEIKDLANITLETLSTLNALDRLKERFIDISADGKVTDSEMSDFNKIRENLEKISLLADTLRFWMDQNIS